MAHGGYRPGAGRKPGGTSKPGPGRTPKRAAAPGPVRAAEDKIRDRLPELVDVALSLAIDERDKSMVVYCLDRVLGKPVQPIDLRDKIREMALAEGLTDEEATEAVAEAERMLKADRGTRR
jgi:hypothetical protein